MLLPPLDLPYQDESNGINIIKIESLDAKILWNNLKFLALDNSVNIDPTNIIHIPLDSSRWDESNGIKLVKIRPLDAEIFTISYRYTNSEFRNFEISDL